MQVVLVNNGSTEPIKKPFKDLFPEIDYIELPENIGFAKANNKGLELASNEFIVLMNSDVVVDKKDTISRCVNKVNHCSKKIILTPALRSPNGEIQVAYGVQPTITREFILSTFLYKLFSKRLRAKLLFDFVRREPRIIDNGWLVATCLVFKKQLIVQLPSKKLFDDTFLYGEEFFWARDWSAIGVDQYYYPDESVIHLVGQSSNADDNNKLLYRKLYQANGEYQFLQTEYKKLGLLIFYSFKLTRLSILSLFDKRLVVLRDLSFDILIGRFYKKYSFLLK